MAVSTDAKFAAAFAVLVVAWVALVWLTTPRGPDERPRWHTRKNR